MIAFFPCASFETLLVYDRVEYAHRLFATLRLAPLHDREPDANMYAIQAACDPIGRDMLPK